MELDSLRTSTDPLIQKVYADLEEEEKVFASIEEGEKWFARATEENILRIEQFKREILDLQKTYVDSVSHELHGVRGLIHMEENKEHAEMEAIKDMTKEKKRLNVEANEVEGAIAHLENTKNSIPAKHRTLKDSLKEKKREHRDMKEEVQEKEKRFTETISKLQKTLSQYQDALGLKMEILSDGHIRFIFIAIDPRDSRKGFKVQVKREGEDRLRAVSCDPMVERFSQLKEELEADSNLVKFLRDIRKEFKAYASSQE